MKSLTTLSLGAELKERYQAGLTVGNGVAAIHLFGIEFADTIENNGFSPSEVLKESGISSSYLTELYKGIKVAKLGVRKKQIDYSVDELVSTLKNTYKIGLEKGDAIGEIFMFGIKYGTFIKASNVKPQLLIDKAKLLTSLRTELAKGIKLSGQVTF